MPTGKAKTAAQLQAEIKRLEAQLEQKNQADQATKMLKSREFKSVQSAINDLGMSDKEILSLFKPAAAAGKPGRKASKAKSAKKTARKKTTKRKSAKGVKSSASDKRAVVAPKYQHPENKDLVWSGRGRQANWVTEALANGKTLDDLLVNRG